MANLSFMWRHNLPGHCASQRTAGSCASVYKPVEVKQGFWANCGNSFLFATVCFACSLFILIHGWNNGLALGGPCYYAFAIMAPLLWGTYALHIVRQHYRLAKVADAEDDETPRVTTTAAEPVEVSAQVPDVAPGESVQLVYGLWGESDRHSTEMEHRGGDEFAGYLDAGELLREVREGVVQYHVEHLGRDNSKVTDQTCLIVRLEDSASS